MPTLPIIRCIHCPHPHLSPHGRQAVCCGNTDYGDIIALFCVAREFHTSPYFILTTVRSRSRYLIHEHFSLPAAVRYVTRSRIHF